MNPFRLGQFAVESTSLLTMRMTLGDEATADILFEQEYDHGFVSRHSNQITSLIDAKYKK
ncbi:hypothetical protein HVTV-2_gp44 [Haloarcula virus HVTV-2]|uniref:Uncharacterized protein n=1 Tax=Haloarcula vallismortis tailed virus 1 TaxID=1262528 RepID=L7TGT9_9CAUD|nr:hypothetical protein HVTV1_44 [Haloarcula vallismortis tailed virus 1]AGC34414.1 hypothetical protein HVTV1_44 [Haloarcula vallismortis tailed virus 1]UBF22851.1 hypothetical protein HVTV-2_gp44 [Haloarcula virus HVTV-2]